MIIDMHNHTLSGVDDGSGSMEETKEMLHIASEEGIKGIVATSHYRVGQGETWLERYERAFSETEDYIQKEKLPMRLYRGCEIFYGEGVLEELQDGKIHTINGTKYILVEFPIYVGFSQVERAIRTLCNGGYRPIIAHVERYEELRDIKRLKALRDIGAYIQMNAGTIMGRMGWKVKWFCLKALKKRLIHVVGTDAHGSEHRRPHVQKCLSYLDKKVGKAYRILLSEVNPQKIIKGEQIRGEDCTE